MTNNFRALCADLIEAVLSDDSHIDCTEIARRARAALADEPPEPIPPADGEAAECTAELEGQKPRPDYDRVQKIATEAQIRSAAQYLAKKQHCDGDLIPAIRYAIARWGHPAPPPADGEVAELVETLKGIAYWRLHGKPGDKPAPFDIRQAARLTRAAELLERLSPPQPLANGEVAELAAEIRHFLAGYQQMRGLDPEHIYSIHRGDKMEAHITVSRLTRAAELLERQAVVPVAVSERPWEREGWCDAEGRCWWGTPGFVNSYTVAQSAQWRLSTPDDRFGSELLCLPAHALPEVG